jgi:hypothetical protein
MPKDRPGRRYDAIAVRAVLHGAPCIVDNIAGVASKQKQPPAAVGLGGSPNPQVNIAVGEKFTIITKGEVNVPLTAASPRGTPIYITPATDALTTVAAGAAKFGRVVAVAGERAVPAGYMAVDLDQRASF